MVKGSKAYSKGGRVRKHTTIGLNFQLRDRLKFSITSKFKVVLIFSMLVTIQSKIIIYPSIEKL